jgi:hypothetical protein
MRVAIPKTNSTPIQIQTKVNQFDNIERRQRRSKNDTEGRNYLCSYCGKSYLSQPALTNHVKSKHKPDDPELKRGRGRPRKNVIISSYSLIQFNLKRIILIDSNNSLTKTSERVNQENRSLI